MDEPLSIRPQRATTLPCPRARVEGAKKADREASVRGE